MTKTPVQVDPWPTDKMQINLTEDAKYTDLDWTNAPCGATGIKKISSLANNAIVARGGKEADNEPRIAYVDYNCFFNPHAPAAAPYDPDINQRKDAGRHDVHADPKFAKGALIPYAVDQADVWNRKFSVSQVLSAYRERYAPAADSPLLNVGDPVDGKNSYIGAIGPGGDAVGDRFGRTTVAR